MKNMGRFFGFFGGCVSVLCLCNAWAETVSCPAGCFCVNEGKYNNSTGDNSQYCNEKARPISSSNQCESNVLNFDGGRIDCVRNLSDKVEARYFLDEFSELYDGYFGLYGVIDGEIIYMPRDNGMHNVYSCPVSYPMSASGAKSLKDCFKYDANGKKVYYGAKQTIKCSAGTYLPINTTQCASCSASKNQVCPGGTFSRSSTNIQGLKVECYPGQYLPAGATQCSSCNDDYYLCLGGIFEVDNLKPQGRILNNGYVISGNHTVKTCRAGYYMPAQSNNCTACPDEYVCPGGTFYVDGQYDFARGIMLCAYGRPDATRTYCVSSTTQPSYMAGKMSMAARMASSLNQSSGSDDQGVNIGQGVTPEQQKQSDLDAAKKMISVGMGVPVKNTKTVTVVQQQPEVVTVVQPQTDLDTAKKMISLGMGTSATGGAVTTTSTTTTQQTSTGTTSVQQTSGGVEDAKKLISAGMVSSTTVGTSTTNKGSTNTNSNTGTSSVATAQPAIRSTTEPQGNIEDAKKMISVGMM